jgi:hypothetical protein
MKIKFYNLLFYSKLSFIIYYLYYTLSYKIMLKQYKPWTIYIGCCVFRWMDPNIFPIMNPEEAGWIHPLVEIQRCDSVEPCKLTVDIVKAYNVQHYHPTDNYKFLPYDPKIPNCGIPAYAKHTAR